MIIENDIIDVLSQSDLVNAKSCRISNSIIKTIDFLSFEANIEIIIEKSIIHDFIIHTCWFRQGLFFTGNRVVNDIDYQMGGHNQKPIIISGNIFDGFFNFFDCSFMSEITLSNNIFSKGTNILGNMGEGFKNVFDKGFIANNNIGALDLNII